MSAPSYRARTSGQDQSARCAATRRLGAAQVGGAARSPGSKKWKRRGIDRERRRSRRRAIRVRGSTRAVNSVRSLGEERRVVVLARGSNVGRDARCVDAEERRACRRPSSSTHLDVDRRGAEAQPVRARRPRRPPAGCRGRRGRCRRAGPAVRVERDRGARRSASSSPSIAASTRFIAGEPMNAATKRFARLVVERLRLVDLDDLPVAHDRDALAERHRLGLVVRDVDRRDAELRVELRQRGAHADPQLRVEVRERLVHQERLRLAHDRAAHRDALALAAGELRRLAVEHARSRPSSSATSSTRRAISAFGPCRTLSP